MRLPTELAILLFTTAAVAQTQWVTATIDNQVVSWIWSVTPSGTVAPTTPSSGTLTTSSSSSSAVSSTSSITSTSSTTSAASTPSSTSLDSSTSSSRSTKQESSTSSSSAISSRASSTSSSTTSATTSSSSTISLSTSSSSTIPTSSSSLTSSISTTSSSSALPTSSDTSLTGITLTQAAAPIPTASLSDASSSASSGGLSNNNTLLKIILSVVISILAVLILAILLFLCLRRRRRNKDASRGSFRPVDQEKQDTSYHGHGEPTLPAIYTPTQSDLHLHMPKPTLAPEMRQLRQNTQDTLYEPSPIEPDHARNPFMGSQERLSALIGPAPARGRYAPVTGQPTKHTMAISHELPAQQMDRPPISALNSSAEASHDSRPSSDGYSYGDLGGSGYGDLGLVGHAERYQDDPAADSAADSQYPSAARPAKRAPHPPSVVASSLRPWLRTSNAGRSQAFYHPADQRQSFDFGFGRPDSGIAATGYRKSPSASVDERAPMAVSPQEEEEGAEDEAGTGGMVPLGQASRTPPSAGRKSSLSRGSLRRESLNDRLGSLRRTASVSIRRGSGSTGGSGSRYSIPRRPVGQ